MADIALLSTEHPTLITIEDILGARPQRPIASTRGRGWSGVTLDLHRPYFKLAESYAGLDHHLICYCPSGSAKLIQRRDGMVHHGVITSGASYIMPAGYESSWEGDSGWSARMRIPTSLVDLASEQFGKRNDPAEIRNVFQVRDTVIENIALVLLAEMEQKAHPAQALIVESMSTALVAHILRTYNAFEVTEGALDRSLSKLEIVRLTEYIEDNLDRTISLEELAALINVSRFHFSRLFKRNTGSTAIAFVEKIRIRRAQALIMDTDLSLADIALAVGFADQSHFTRRFHLHVRCTPAVFARERGRRRTCRQRPTKSDSNSER